MGIGVGVRVNVGVRVGVEVRLGVKVVLGTAVRVAVGGTAVAWAIEDEDEDNADDSDDGTSVICPTMMGVMVAGARAVSRFWSGASCVKKKANKQIPTSRTTITSRIGIKNGLRSKLFDGFDCGDCMVAPRLIRIDLQLL